MTDYTRKLRRSILLWQVAGASGLSCIYLFVALIFSRWLSVEWQTIVWRAFILSFGGAFAAVAFISWRQGKIVKQKPEKPE